MDNDFDFIAASFVRKASDVEDIRAELRKHGGDNIRIIAKIENREGVENLEGIIAASDGIMVARGDLGVEIPATRCHPPEEDDQGHHPGRPAGHHRPPRCWTP